MLRLCGYGRLHRSQCQPHSGNRMSYPFHKYHCRWSLADGWCSVPLHAADLLFSVFRFPRGSPGSPDAVCSNSASWPLPCPVRVHPVYASAWTAVWMFQGSFRPLSGFQKNLLQKAYGNCRRSDLCIHHKIHKLRVPEHLHWDLWLLLALLHWVPDSHRRLSAYQFLTFATTLLFF